MKSFQEIANEWMKKPETGANVETEYGQGYRNGARALASYLSEHYEVVPKKCVVPNCVMTGKHGKTSEGEPGHHIVVPQPPTPSPVEELLPETDCSCDSIYCVHSLPDLFRKVNELIRSHKALLELVQTLQK